MGRVPRPPAEPPTGARLSIGALSRATGIPVETLRTWESRYGFPVPERKPSGHRVYPLAIVPRLVRIAQALSQGHRAREVLTASESDLQDLLATADGTVPPRAPTTDLMRGTDTEELLGLVSSLDADRLAHLLLAEWARLGPLPFLEQRIGPLVREVGEAWAAKRLQIRHEHFLSERLGDLLRTLRLPFEERARGPLVVLATLPGEGHGLGLQMAALLLATSGCRVLNLGTAVPIRELLALSADLPTRALAISVSEATAGAGTSTALRRLRGELPRRVALLVGGAGAPSPPPAGVQYVAELRVLQSWAERAADVGRAR
jgi:DNA-binding transcriptional MerR regulator/methylmalonyl-CoA mutase cobalamin-binding subunit